MNNKPNTVRVITYNCRGYNSTKQPYLASLLVKCDFLFLQEHWLSQGQLDSLNEISRAHSVTAISGFGHREVLQGRPFGECAIFWRRNSDMNVEIPDTFSSRMCALRAYNSNNDLLFINVYMPYEGAESKNDDFCTVLSQIECLIEQYPQSQICLGGDFNTDFSRSFAHSDILSLFCNTNNVFPVISHEDSEVDYTYNFCMKRFSIIDHFIVSRFIYECICNVQVIHDADNFSDHDPLLIVLNYNWK